MLVPQRGDKLKIVNISLQNANYFRIEQNKQLKIIDPEKHSNRIMQQIKQDLRLPELPIHIECFDNSNIQGTNPVAACVVFKNAKPSKKDYRHFNIKTVEGPDDFASMREVVYRRYSRLVNENEPLPQLIVIDGGKGQLSAAVSSLKELRLEEKISIVGIAKRLEEIYFPNDPIPLYIDKRSESLKVIQQLRNEAHRFGITHHRGKRIKAGIKTELTEIEGVGEKTAQMLLKKFKTVSAIKKLTEEELVKAVNLNVAKAILKFYKSEKE